MRKCVQVIALFTMLTLVNTTAQNNPFPTLTVKKQPQEAISLEQLEIRVEVLNNIAVTFMEMSFYNPTNRVLEGELNFPLQDNVSVSHFAMDVNGKMRNGVVVEKSEGTRVFETIVRQQVDPGLLQKSEGNNFKARVYPIPAKGYKRIQLAYEHTLKSDGTRYIYQLPLHLEKPLKVFKVKAQVLNSAAVPQVVDSQQINLIFNEQHEAFIATFEAINYLSNKQLSFALPFDITTPTVVTSKGGINGNKTYFYINAQAPTRYRLKPKPSTITLCYDISGSTLDRSKTKEFALLDNYFNWAKEVKVRLITFATNTEIDSIFTITQGNWSGVKSILDGAIPDGATQYSNLQFDNFPSDEILMFSDGLLNFGNEQLPISTSPIYTINSSQQVSSNYLTNLAQKSAGVHLNLTTLTTEEAFKGLTTQKLQFLYAEFNQSELADVTPSSPTHFNHNLSVVGQILETSATITLHYGFTSSILQQKYTISGNHLIKEGVIERLWVQKKIADLELFPQRNRKEIIELGKRYQVVTSFTSLIVLDNLEDYIQHRILPPVEMQADYIERIKELNTLEMGMAANYLQTIVTDFNTKVRWYEEGCPKVHKQKITESRELSMMSVREDPEEVSNLLRDVPPPPPVLRNTIKFTAPVIRSDNEVAEEEATNIDYDSGTDEMVAENVIEEEISTTASSILVTEWNPNDPFIDSLKTLPSHKIYPAYLQKRLLNKELPSALFLDVASLLYSRSQKRKAVKVLSNLAESTNEDFENLRVLGRKLIEFEEFDYAIEVFKKVVSIRPFEAHSYRDLGLAYASKKEYQKSIETLYSIVRDSKLDVTAGFTTILVGEMNNIFFHSDTSVLIPNYDPRLAKHQPVDIRIVLEWDAPNTDMDLWVTDPNGEKCSYEHNRTQICGYLSPDNTSGYGPEEFLLKKAIAGKYLVEVNYFGTRSQKLSNPITVQMLMYTNYGRKNETVQRTTIRLTSKKEIIKIGELDFKNNGVVDLKKEAKPNFVLIFYIFSLALPLLITISLSRIKKRVVPRFSK